MQFSQAQAQAQSQPATNPSAPRCSLTQPPRADPININYHHDCCKDLGVHSQVSTGLINRGFQSKCNLTSLAGTFKRYPTNLYITVVDVYNPTQAKWKWTSTPNNARNIQGHWERIQKAHAILTDPELRAKYDTGRTDAGPWHLHEASLYSIPAVPCRATNLSVVTIIKTNGMKLLRTRIVQRYRSTANFPDERCFLHDRRTFEHSE
jgi:hypothetical protein